MSRLHRHFVIFALILLCSLLAAGAEQQPASPQMADAGSSSPEQAQSLLHAVHKKTKLVCSGCHVAVKDDSVVLQRPGHDECTTCHQDEFDAKKPSMCIACHSNPAPTSNADLIPYPFYQKKRALLIEFSHAKHVDPLARLDPVTHTRADCSFCHQLDAKGAYASFPAHPQCAACHSKAGMKPLLSPDSVTRDCRGCHAPEAIEKPGSGGKLAPQLVSGAWANIKFSHVAHFKVRDQYKLDCSTCHSSILTSTSLENQNLPKMIECVGCHETSKAMAAEFRMSNCQTCHVDNPSGPRPASHTRYIKPDFHTESFRKHHSAEASAPGAKCFVCHTNVSPQAAAAAQCTSCHQAMLPASHTARWRDDIHGKYAAMDRESCATCHATDYCSRCHNELPRTHVPLAPFVNGGHAKLAMINKRSCFACHTYENTCAECHVKSFR